MDRNRAAEFLTTLYAELDGKGMLDKFTNENGMQRYTSDMQEARGFYILTALGYEFPRGIQKVGLEKKLRHQRFVVSKATDGQAKTAAKLSKLGWNVTHIAPITDGGLKLPGAVDAVEFDVQANGSKGTIKRDGTFIRK